MRKFAVLAYIGASVTVAASGRAAGPSATAAPVMSAPASPAFDAIGASPTTIAHPTTIQSMGATLLSYIDQRGRVNAGVALEAAPLWLLLGDTITLQDWQAHYATRALSRLSLSFASSANAAGLTDISQGLRFVMWDGSDSRWDFELAQCLAKTLTVGLPSGENRDLPDDTDTGETAPVVADAGVKQCQDQAKKRASKLNAGVTSGAFSTAVTEQQDQAGKATFGQYFAWLSATQNLGRGARWLSLFQSLRYVYTHPGHELDIGARVRAGNTSLGISLDGAWTPRRVGDDWKARAGVVGLNGEIRVSDSLWLTATAGGRFGADSSGAPDLFSVLHFKFATESAAGITPM